MIGSKKNSNTNSRSIKKITIFDSKLNEAWKKEYGFFLEDMFIIMMNLGRWAF